MEALRPIEVAEISRGHSRVGQPVRRRRPQGYHRPPLGGAFPRLQHPRHHLHEHRQKVQLKSAGTKTFRFKKHALSLAGKCLADCRICVVKFGRNVQIFMLLFKAQ